jgi:hypothetical protein
LRHHRPAFWQARRNSFEHLARDGVLAAKTYALIRLACAMHFADRVVKVEVDFSSLTTFLTLLDGKGDLRLKEFCADALGAPRADPQKVGPIRSLGRFDELALQSSQSMLALADQ